MKWRDRRKKRRKKESSVEKLETLQEIKKPFKNYNIIGVGKKLEKACQKDYQ